VGKIPVFGRKWDQLHSGSDAIEAVADVVELAIEHALEQKATWKSCAAG
jgi:hypothetical protein